MKKNTIHSGFTLVEVIVALTIFSLIMTSVMTVFYLASQMTNRIELQRHMQENIKNTLDIIAQDIRKNKIIGGEGLDTSCKGSFTQGEKKSKLCLRVNENIVYEYSLGKKDNAGNFVYDSSCSELTDQCYIIKKDESGLWYPLTNSMSHITRLDFTFGNTDHPKVMITLGIRPALMKGMASNLLEAQEMIVQTTLSERFIQQN